MVERWVEVEGLRMMMKKRGKRRKLEKVVIYDELRELGVLDQRMTE